ncbi:MAG: hypothetical protein Ct9H90mP22_8540 [Gammaproteobacteria bacterium]|nr:MAG: hypothetical protein Ct9H90mP22_8540 [Gammaproteobacteria bacterium]
MIVQFLNGVQYIITERPSSDVLMLEYSDIALREIRDYFSWTELNYFKK